MSLLKKVKCNFRTMGKKFGKLMKSVAAAVDALSQEQIAELEANGKLMIGNVDAAGPVEILVEDVEIISEDIPGWLVSNEGSLTVALEVELTEELRQEGMAREIINRVQNIRKDSGLEITDRIHIALHRMTRCRRRWLAMASISRLRFLPMTSPSRPMRVWKSSLMTLN